MRDAALWALLALVVAATVSIVAHTLKVGISPMPSSALARAAVLSLTVESLKGGSHCEIHELGAGWGTLAFPLARSLPEARVVAWESSLVPYLFCLLRRAVSRVSNLELRRADFHEAQLGSADAVVCYLFTGGMERLAPKLERELRDCAIVVSNTFGLRGWTAETTRTLDDLYHSPVYRYVKRTRTEAA